MTHIDELSPHLMYATETLEKAQQSARQAWTLYVREIARLAIEGDRHVVVDEQDIQRGMSCLNTRSTDALVADIQHVVDQQWRSRNNCHPSDPVPLEVALAHPWSLGDNPGPRIIEFVTVSLPVGS